jgi:hypothetical protein
MSRKWLTFTFRKDGAVTRGDVTRSLNQRNWLGFP